MSLNIKNESVHAAVRELAARLGVGQTSAVELAVRAALDALDAAPSAEDRAARIARAAAAAQHAFAGVDLRAAERDLYDDAGLPR
ncbi:type II toxin-antitoxin system VapB family antitoxin [Microbacterium sp. LMI1-1-1.1]|uniref:type II toxin-antitoxin system VapB family antitoxin n=1 Tax=Microbacterium sp. LMI1-1-1.1 TaxID=3135223 RepID=UPI0034669153